jgi:hypothetical protein
MDVSIRMDTFSTVLNVIIYEGERGRGIREGTGITQIPDRLKKRYIGN